MKLIIEKKISIKIFLIWFIINLLFSNLKINVSDGYTQYLAAKNFI